MRHASEHLTPVTLELGGKSPCIVEKTANLKLAARRIVFGKYLNCGQTCVAPDYIYCEKEIKDALIQELKREIIRQFGASPLKNQAYGKIINEKHFYRIMGLIDSEKIAYGGRYNEEALQIEPTILDDVTWEDAVMKEEIFGPVVCVTPFDTEEEAIAIANSTKYGLAGGVFTKDIKRGLRVAQAIDSGQIYVNSYFSKGMIESPGTGWRESGLGVAGIQKYMISKTIFVDTEDGSVPY